MINQFVKFDIVGWRGKKSIKMKLPKAKTPTRDSDEADILTNIRKATYIAYSNCMGNDGVVDFREVRILQTAVEDYWRFIRALLLTEKSGGRIKYNELIKDLDARISRINDIIFPQLKKKINTNKEFSYMLLPGKDKRKPNILKYEEARIKLREILYELDELIQNMNLGMNMIQNEQ